jgi:large subunit ribosomal protein L23
LSSVLYSGSAAFHQLILSSRVTEKTTHLLEMHNAVVLRVAVDATKTQVRDAVESIWAVRVIAVRTIRRVGKQRRRGKYVGASADSKFAIVQLHADDRLSFY